MRRTHFTCTVNGCGKKHDAKGYCHYHYRIWKAHGDPLYVAPTRQAEKCRLDGCSKLSESRGMCAMHYERWRKYGDPAIIKQRQNHTGCSTGTGYWHTQIDGRRIQDHVRIAETVLGRRLPKGAVVHHADQDPMNNAPSNLVICPSTAYHALLHTRLRAMEACGNPSWRKCWICKKHDDPDAMAEVKRSNGSYFYHLSCVRRRHAEKVTARKDNHDHVS